MSKPRPKPPSWRCCVIPGCGKETGGYVLCQAHLEASAPFPGDAPSLAPASPRPVWRDRWRKPGPKAGE